MEATMQQATAVEPLIKQSYWIGKCMHKGCKNVIRETREMRGEKRMHYPGWGAQSYLKTEWRMIGQHPIYLNIWCVAHKRAIRWKCVNGTYSAEHTCDSRCMNATGPNCECSCGGANHGKSYDPPVFKFKVI